MNENTSPQEKTIFGHPKGLFYLFFAELWERFSFYGMRALLTLYMVNKIFASLAERDALAAAIFAAYGSLVYASPVIGGRLADKLLGYRKAIILGGILMMLGHLSLAFEPNFMFFLGLGLLSVGNGFFKPNISTFVGTLYGAKDKRKDSGFTIFYMGINIGGAIAPLLCGYLGATYGWHYGFSLAAFGMLLGLLVFMQGVKAGIFMDKGLSPAPEALKKPFVGIRVSIWVYVLAFAAAPVLGWLISYTEKLPGLNATPVGLLFSAIGVLILIAVIYILAQSPPKERYKLGAAMVLIFWMTIFWGFFELQGNTLTLFAERNVNLFLFNASQTNSINSLFILLLAIPISFLWQILSKYRLNPRSPYKFAFGLLWASLAFFALWWSKDFANADGRVPFIFLLFAYFLISTGELLMSPVGLSKMTDLAPKRIVAFMMGVWFLSSAYAFQIVGLVGQWLAVEGSAEGNRDPWLSLDIYTQGFFNIAIGLLLVGALAVITAPIIKRWMQEVH